MKDKKCEVCGKSMYESRKKKGLPTSPSYIKKYTACSKECRKIKHKKKIERLPDRYCATCGKKLVMRENETGHYFKKRRFCDRECFSVSRQGVSINSKKQSKSPIDKKNPIDKFLYS